MFDITPIVSLKEYYYTANIWEIVQFLDLC